MDSGIAGRDALVMLGMLETLRRNMEGAAHHRLTDAGLIRNAFRSTLELKYGDHSTLDRSGTGMRAKYPEESRCYTQVFREADSGRLLCAPDQQNVRADDLQIQ